MIRTLHVLLTLFFLPFIANATFDSIPEKRLPFSDRIMLLTENTDMDYVQDSIYPEGKERIFCLTVRARQVTAPSLVFNLVAIETLLEAVKHFAFEDTACTVDSCIVEYYVENQRYRYARAWHKIDPVGGAIESKINCIGGFNESRLYSDVNKKNRCIYFKYRVPQEKFERSRLTAPFSNLVALTLAWLYDEIKDKDWVILVEYTSGDKVLPFIYNKELMPLPSGKLFPYIQNVLHSDWDQWRTRRNQLIKK